MIRHDAVTLGAVNAPNVLSFEKSLMPLMAVSQSRRQPDIHPAHSGLFATRLIVVLDIRIGLVALLFDCKLSFGY